MVDDRTAHRAAVEAGYASLQGYIEQWGHEVVEQTQKRYADDVTVQELVRLRVENERLLEALHVERKLRNHALELAIDLQKEVDRLSGYSWSVAAALQQKESE